MPINYKNYNIPHKPGCYLYKDGKGEVIYVGKAKDLQKRVSQYFQKQLDAKTRKLVNAIRDIEFITTSSEVEALILEQSLIHQYDPKYNISLKGNIRYAYIKVTDEDYPRIMTARKITKDGRFYGPYTDGTARRLILKTLQNLFKIRTCNKMPKKVCLQYHIKKCLGPCEFLISKEEYKNNVRNAERLLKGDTKGIVQDLEKAMKAASEEQKYELAKAYRDQISAIEYIKEKQKIDLPKDYDQNVINWLQIGKRIYFQVFYVKRGVITTRDKFSFECYDGVIEDFFNLYYSINTIPREIVIPEKLDDQATIARYLQKTKHQKFSMSYIPKVEIIVPKRGDKLKLLQLVKENLEIEMGYEPGLVDLKHILNLERIPEIIEFFDISTLQGTYNVGAMIQLKNGKENKSAYRKFKIRTKETQDDFAMMYEVVKRRYSRLQKEKSQFPDLIVIDGGRGQLNAALKALEDLGVVDQAIVSLAKREEEIYIPGKSAPLNLDNSKPGMRLLIRGRDDVHNFVIAYHRLLRSKRGRG